MAISYKSLSAITWNCQSIAMLSIYQYLYQEKNPVIHGEMNTRSHFKSADSPHITLQQTPVIWSPEYYSTLGIQLPLMSS